MRYLITLLTCLFILSPSVVFGDVVFGDTPSLTDKVKSWFSSEQIDAKDLIFREGIHYKKFSDVPFSGKVTGEKQGTLQNGKEEGPWVRYHENGQLGDKGDYKNGKKEGPWVHYHENGQLGAKADYKNGKKEGPWVYYHENGQLFNKGDYKNGKKEGPWVHYYKNGQLWDKGDYKNGVKTSD